jgi:hypothetical protein
MPPRRHRHADRLIGHRSEIARGHRRSGGEVEDVQRGVGREVQARPDLGENVPAHGVIDDPADDDQDQQRKEKLGSSAHFPHGAYLQRAGAPDGAQATP